MLTSIILIVFISTTTNGKIIRAGSKGSDGHPLSCAYSTYCWLITADVVKNDPRIDQRDNSKYIDKAFEQLDKHRHFTGCGAKGFTRNCEKSLWECEANIEDIAEFSLKIRPDYLLTDCDYTTWSFMLFLCKNYAGWPEEIKRYLPPVLMNCPYKTCIVVHDYEEYHQKMGVTVFPPGWNELKARVDRTTGYTKGEYAKYKTQFAQESLEYWMKHVAPQQQNRQQQQQPDVVNYTVNEHFQMTTLFEESSDVITSTEEKCPQGTFVDSTLYYLNYTDRIPRYLLFGCVSTEVPIAHTPAIPRFLLKKFFNVEQQTSGFILDDDFDGWHDNCAGNTATSVQPDQQELKQFMIGISAQLERIPNTTETIQFPALGRINFVCGGKDGIYIHPDDRLEWPQFHCSNGLAICSVEVFTHERGGISYIVNIRFGCCPVPDRQWNAATLLTAIPWQTFEAVGSIHPILGVDGTRYTSNRRSIAWANSLQPKCSSYPVRDMNIADIFINATNNCIAGIDYISLQTTFRNYWHTSLCRPGDYISHMKIEGAFSIKLNDDIIKLIFTCKNPFSNTNYELVGIYDSLQLNGSYPFRCYGSAGCNHVCDQKGGFSAEMGTNENTEEQRYSCKHEFSWIQIIGKPIGVGLRGNNYRYGRQRSNFNDVSLTGSSRHWYQAPVQQATCPSGTLVCGFLSNPAFDEQWYPDTGVWLKVVCCPARIPPCQPLLSHNMITHPCNVPGADVECTVSYRYGVVVTESHSQEGEEHRKFAQEVNIEVQSRGFEALIASFKASATFSFEQFKSSKWANVTQQDVTNETLEAVTFSVKRGQTLLTSQEYAECGDFRINSRNLSSLLTPSALCTTIDELVEIQNTNVTTNSTHGINVTVSFRGVGLRWATNPNKGVPFAFDFKLIRSGIPENFWDNRNLRPSSVTKFHWLDSAPADSYVWQEYNRLESSSEMFHIPPNTMASFFQIVGNCTGNDGITTWEAYPRNILIEERRITP